MCRWIKEVFREFREILSLKQLITIISPGHKPYSFLQLPTNKVTKLLYTNTCCDKKRHQWTNFVGIYPCYLMYRTNLVVKNFSEFDESEIHQSFLPTFKVIMSTFLQQTGMLQWKCINLIGAWWNFIHQSFYLPKFWLWVCQSFLPPSFSSIW